jgi:membrane-associated phospholipid phosphatase
MKKNTNLKSSKLSLFKAGPAWIFGVPLVCLILLFVLHIGGWNRGLFLLFNGFAQNFAERIWAFLSFFADGLVVFVVIFPLIRKKPEHIWAVLIASVLFLIFGQGMKQLIDAARPPAVLTPQEFRLIGPELTRNAFPSGHSATIFALCGVFCLTTAKTWLRVLLLLLAAIIAFSRIAMGVHWPGDVVTGALLGWVLIWAGLKLAPLMRWGWQGLGQKILGALLVADCVLVGIVNHTGHDEMMIEQRLIALVFLVWGSVEYLKVFRSSNLETSNPP